MSAGKFWRRAVRSEPARSRASRGGVCPLVRRNRPRDQPGTEGGCDFPHPLAQGVGRVRRPRVGGRHGAGEGGKGQGAARSVPEGDFREDSGLSFSAHLLRRPVIFLSDLASTWAGARENRSREREVDMVKWTMVAMVAALAGCAGMRTMGDGDFASGHWIGEIDRDGSLQPLLLDIARENGAYRGRVQSVAGVPARTLENVE